MQEAPLLDKAFDIEAFTYMLNRNSCFTSGNLMYGNFIKLQSILVNLLKYDPVYLEVLHYTIETDELSRSHSYEPEEKNKVKNLKDVKNLIDSIWVEKEFKITTKSALHEAFKSGNNRVIDIILGHMALIDINNSSVFSDLMPHLTDISSFGRYLENLVT
jgi:hypothetical protein